MKYTGMAGPNLLRFLLSSRGLKNILTRTCTVVHRFGFTPNKMRSALNQWLSIIRKFGVPVSFPVTAIIVKRYPKLFKELQAKGLEFAVHGYTHIDYSALSMEKQLTHFTYAIRIFNSNGIGFKGFRAPYTRWNDHTFNAIKKLNFSWDSSKTVMWDVINSQLSSLKPQYMKVLALYNPESANVSPVLPELKGEVVEIPLSLPDDEMLLDRFGFSCQKIQEVWEHMLTHTYTRGELFTLQLHPERLPLCKYAIEVIINRAHKYNPKIWVASLSEIAAWWRERLNFRAEVKDMGRDNYKIIFHCSSRATIILKNVKSQLPQIEPWYNSYQILHINGVKELDIHSKVYPIVFAGNSLPPEVNDSETPIIWFWRWPYGARSCLSLTSDIDALTLADFLMRLVGK